MSEALKCSYEGKECYEILGRDEPCDACIARRSVFNGTPHEKEEIINGKVFSVMSSPIKNEEGEIVAVVEVLRDITQLKQLQQKILEQNEKLKSDLNLARKLQCSLLPRQLPNDRIEFSFVYKPCEALGGDFLDIFKIDDDNFGIYVADVSGHGVPASMLTVFLRSSINRKTLSPARALEELHREFNANNFDPDLYITVFYAVINLNDKLITYSNAGHNVSPIIFGNDRFELLRIPGTPISNWVSDPEYRDGVASLQSGNRIFFYTDGIIEMKNSKNEMFGEERLLELLLSSRRGPSETLNGIIESVCQFTGLENTLDIPDDITMALLEVK